jgi:phage terminase large subunit-like protein
MMVAVGKLGALFARRYQAKPPHEPRLRSPTVAISRGTTYDNCANLAGAFLDQIVNKYEGTRLGRQELNAELLDDVPGALWSRALIEAARPPMGFVMPDLVRVVVAIDPAASSGEDADETGIIVAGKDKDSRGYVLADLSGHHTPIEWARIACAAYKSHGADRIVAEVNNGGLQNGGERDTTVVAVLRGRRRSARRRSPFAEIRYLS